MQHEGPTSTPTFTVVLPCYNEAARITHTLRTIEDWFGSRAAALVVDDGSGDETSERARSSGHRHAVVHRLPANRGKGAAVRAAIPLIRTPHVVLMDADLAYDRDSVERTLEALAHADVVIGNRRHDGSRYLVPVRLFGFLYRRHVVGMTFNALVRLLLPIHVRDTQCGLKGFRREALEAIAPRLTIDGFAFDVELLVVAQSLRLRLIDVPVRVTYESAKSSVKLLRTAIAMASSLLLILGRRAMGRYRPGRDAV
jgi:glycosyltransferase involved in cell wall biosynthesis